MNRRERRKHLTRHLPVVASRQCGECTACCTILAVQDVHKDYYEKCVHDTGRCDIYATKPAVCTTFRCVWHAEGLPDEFRPDRLGVMIDVSGPSPFGPIPVVWELYDGAAEQPAVQFLIETWNRRGKPVIVASKDRRRIIGAPKDVQIEMLR